MRTSLFFISFLLIITSCRSKSGVPANVLPQKKMQAMLWDMMRADQFLADYVLSKDTSLKKGAESIKLYQQILAINNVTKEKFEESFSFYKSHPALLKAIMDSIVNIPEQTILDTIKPPPSKDSLKKIIDSLSIDSIKKRKRPMPVKGN